MNQYKFTQVFVALVLAGGGVSEQSDQSEDEPSGPGFSLTYTDVMEFVRGVPGEYDLSGHFDDESAATITIDGLPDGAALEGNKLTWVPSCDLKPANGQFIRGYEVYRIRISLDANTSDNIVQRPALIVLHKDGEGSPCGS